MKYILGLVTFLFSSVALAGPHHHGHRHFHHRHWHSPPVHHWVVPALIGGAVVYAATRPDPVVVQQPTVVLQPNQVVIDGVIYNKQIMIVNGIQQEVLVRQ
jgi:hypothetical protein